MAFLDPPGTGKTRLNKRFANHAEITH
ncbi:hypothetical protein [Mycobacterium sp. URHB0021]